MESYVGLNISDFIEVASLLLGCAALIYAALAFRVSKQALKTAAESDLATLKLTAHERRTKAERSFFSLQSACQDMRNLWDDHHSRNFPKFGARNFKCDDTRHISEVENQARKLLAPLALDLSELGAMDYAALEDYIERADQSALQIEQLTFRLSPPKQPFV